LNFRSCFWQKKRRILGAKEVRIMSLEAIQKVTETEQNSRTRKAEAAAEAKRIVAEADRMGRQTVADARAAAEEKVKAMMAEAETRAGERTKATQAENAEACAALKERARPQLDRAADLIVEKVGKN
jgi:V/A-type H+-transporting ATPase subunit G/H